jgi:hypothetical protein
MEGSAKESGFDSKERQEFSRLYIVHTGFGGYPFSYPVGTGRLFPRLRIVELYYHLHASVFVIFI